MTLVYFFLMYLCMYKCVYSCLCMWMYCLNMLSCACICVCIPVCTCGCGAHIYWCSCICGCIGVCAYGCTIHVCAVVHTFVCVLMSVLFIFAQVWVHMSVCGQKGWRINSSSVILRKTTSFGTRSFFGLSLLIKIHQTVDELQHFFCLYSLGIPSTYHHTGHFYLVFGDQTQLFILERQGFY